MKWFFQPGRGVTGVEVRWEEGRGRRGGGGRQRGGHCCRLQANSRDTKTW